MDADLRIDVLGPLEVGVGGATIEVPGRLLRALLISLALRPGRVADSDQLIEDVWERDPPANAANALQSLVSRLRRILPPGLIESRFNGYTLLVDQDAVDALRFERLAARGVAAARANAPGAGAALREALALWRGDALADITWAVFATAPAARLTELRLATQEALFAAELAAGNAALVVGELEAAVAAEPLREGLRGQLVRVLCAVGRQADALASYDDLRRTLADELGVDPSPELAELHLAALRGELAAPRRVGPSGAGRTRGAALTSFVGRDRELAELTGSLTGTRLLTLLGTGGVGKTRLAAECLTRLGDGEFESCWVELAPVTEPGDVPHAVLAALGGRGAAMDPALLAGGPAGPVDRLIGLLADRRLILVLDNCEQVIGAVAALVEELLAGCPGLHVLCTSRETLRIPGERRWDVHPFDVPADGSADELAAAPAVRLLLDRAADAGATLPRDRDTLRLLAQIGRGSTGCRSRWSWPRPGCGSSRPPRWPPGWTTGSACSPTAVGPPCPASRPCARWWTGAGTPSTTRNARWPVGSRSSAAASAWTPWRRCAPRPAASTRRTCSTC